MASAEELKGRRIPAFPGAKSSETVTFVGPDGNTIEVVKNIDKGALAVLKKRGFKSQTRALKEQEEAALAKADAANSTSSQEDETAGEDPENEGESRQPTEEGEDESAGTRRASGRSRSRS